MTDEITFRSADPTATLARAVEVLRTVRSNETPWPCDDNWLELLPRWFIDSREPEPTEEQRGAKRQLQAMTYEEKHRYAQTAPWTLRGWISGFQPDRTDLDRGWAWVAGGDHGDNSGSVTVEIDGWPYPHGTLDWLLRTAGAIEITPG